ncbi:MAG: hypothetical protein QNK37_08675 [Acidobacteriota bacterium]|nr:hypothetical protein [Acidobacteriota bacterium]
MKRLKLLLIFITVLIALVTIFLFFNSGGPKVETLASMKLVTAKLPYDNVVETLIDMGTITGIKTGQDDRLNYKQSEIEKILADNAEIFERFNAWRQTTPVPIEWTPEIGNHSRTLDRITYKAFEQYRPPRGLSKMVVLFCLKARSELGRGNVDEGVLWLQAAADVAGLRLQNPTMAQFFLGTSIYPTVMRVVLDIPAEAVTEQHLNLLPDQRTLREAFVKTLYLNRLFLEEQINEGKTYSLRDKAILLATNKRKTLARNREYFLQIRKSAYEPINSWPENLLAAGMNSPTDYLDNPGGRWLLEMSEHRLSFFGIRLGIAIASVDSVRLQLLLKTAGKERTQAATRALVAEHDLRNPFTGELYEVGGQGRIILSNPADADWNRFLKDPALNDLFDTPAGFKKP